MARRSERIDNILRDVLRAFKCDSDCDKCEAQNIGKNMARYCTFIRTLYDAIEGK